MSEITEKALTKIAEKQSKYTENDKHYWIAEQIKDIAAELAEKLSMSSAEVTEFKTAFEQVQTWNGKCLNIIGRIENPETAAKLKTAMQTFLAQALETVKGE